MTLQHSDYREFRNYLEEKNTVNIIGISLEPEMEDLYLEITCSLGGLNLWKLHEEFDVDIVFSWHDPTVDRLRMGFRLQENNENV